MADEQKKEAKAIRQILIETDGNSFNLKTKDVTALELKEICREILHKLGG